MVSGSRNNQKYELIHTSTYTNTNFVIIFLKKTSTTGEFCEISRRLAKLSCNYAFAMVMSNIIDICIGN